MDWIRRTYGVPANRGGRVQLGRGFGSLLGGRAGTITSADGQYLRIRVDGIPGRPLRFHPTWELTYGT